MRTLSNWHSIGWEYCTFGGRRVLSPVIVVFNIPLFNNCQCENFQRLLIVWKKARWLWRSRLQSRLDSNSQKSVQINLNQSFSNSLKCVDLSLLCKTLIECRQSTKSPHLDPLEQLAATPPSLLRRCRGSGNYTLHHKSIS